MWANVDQATKDRLEVEYQKNKEVVAKEKADYEEKYGKIERKKKKKRIEKHDKEEWSISLNGSFINFFYFFFKILLMFNFNRYEQSRLLL